MLPHLAISCWNFVFFWPIWQHCRQMDAALALWLKYRSHLTSINTLLSILCSIHPPWAGENQLPEIFQYLLFELCFYSIFFFLRSVRIWSTARLTEQVEKTFQKYPSMSDEATWKHKRYLQRCKNRAGFTKGLKILWHVSLFNKRLLIKAFLGLHGGSMVNSQGEGSNPGRSPWLSVEFTGRYHISFLFSSLSAVKLSLFLLKLI